MKKKLILAVSAVVLAMVMMVSLVACGYSIGNIDEFMIDFAKTDSKAIAVGENVMAVDGENSYVKFATTETYVIADGVNVDVYISLDGTTWTHENMPKADRPVEGLNGLMLTDEELEAKIAQIEKEYSDFESKFTEGADGFWYANADKIKAIGLKVDGKKIISKAAALGISIETSMEIGYSIKLPAEAKKAKK